MAVKPVLGIGTLHPPVPFSPQAIITPAAYTDLGKTNAERKKQDKITVINENFSFFELLRITFSS
jgi:hypothetical protein